MAKKSSNNQKTQQAVIDQTAAMFEVTALPKEELKTAVGLVLDKPGNPIENIIKDKELEAIHDTEIAEAKELGIDPPIVESTQNEILKTLQKDLEESQNRFAELSEEKERILKERNDVAKKAHELSKQVETLTSEKDDLQKQINELSSNLDLMKTDSTRELVDYKIQIEDMEKKISIYEENESNYKFEITKLKAEIANLETALTEKPEAKKRLEKNLKQTTPARIPMYQPQPQAKSAAKINGYDSWN